MSDEKPDDLKEKWEACCWSPDAERSGDAQISLKHWLRPDCSLVLIALTRTAS